MDNAQYWTERTLLQEQRIREASDKTLNNLKKEYDKAQKDLQEQLEDWYKKYAGETGLSIAQAKKKLTVKEYHAYCDNIEDFIAKAKTGDPKFDAELRQKYVTSRVSRLRALQDQVSLQLELLGKSQDMKTYHLLQQTYKDTFYHNLYNAGQAGILGRFDRLDADLVERICQTPWSGKTFSQRIWGNNKQLIKEVREILAKGAVTGASTEKMSRQLAERMGVSYRRAETLIYTESAFIREQANADSYVKMGVERYEYLATLDKRTSPVCRRLDGQVFWVKEKAAGINYPPMHPRCRSTTVPYYDDEFTASEMRFARDAEGKGIYVDAGMKYGEWYEKYIVQTEPLAKSGLKVFLGAELYATMTAEDWLSMALDFEQMPPEHQEIVNRYVKEINHCSASPYPEHQHTSHYDWVNQTVYLHNDLAQGEFAHELAHVFEYELNLRNNPSYLKLFEPFSEYTITDLTYNLEDYSEMIMLIKDDGRFVSEYQRCLNREMDYLDNGKVNTKAMTEYLAEGYRVYITDPQLLLQKDKPLYEFIHRELKSNG